MNSPTGRGDACAHYYGFLLSNKHCTGGELVNILITGTDKWQETPKNVRVLQLRLAGIDFSGGAVEGAPVQISSHL